jgi:protein TonB
MPGLPPVRGSRAALRWSTLLVVAALTAACGEDKAPTPEQQQAAAVPAGGAPPAPAPAPEPAEPAVDTSTMSVTDLLKSGNTAITEQRLVTPAGNNAVEYYVAVIKQEPTNVVAQQALVDIFPQAASIAERAIQQRQIEEADRIVGLLDQASPGSYTVTTLRTKLDAMKQTIQREIEQQLAAEQRAAEQRAAEERAAAAAAAAPPPPPAAPTPTPEPARPRPAAPPSTQVAATTSPPATTAPPPPAAPSGKLIEAQVVRQVPPQYPPDAYRRRQEGWVELEFTIGTDGKVKDVRVARAQPTRVFDREAIRAMQQWTFKPAQRDGQAVESPGRRRIEFKLGG